MPHGNPHDTPEDVQEIAGRLNELPGADVYLHQPWTDPLTGETKYHVVKRSGRKRQAPLRARPAGKAHLASTQLHAQLHAT